METQTMERNEYNSSRPESGNKSTKKTQNEENLEMKSLETQTGTSEASLSNRIQETEKRHSDADNNRERDTSMEEHGNTKSIPAQKISEGLGQ